MVEPTAVEAVVLVLAGHRLTRLIGWDHITKRWRQRLLGYDDNGQRNAWPVDRKPLAEFIHCPWCIGFWIALMGWLALQLDADVLLWGAWPLAISSAIGLVSSNWDA